MGVPGARCSELYPHLGKSFGDENNMCPHQVEPTWPNLTVFSTDKQVIEHLGIGYAVSSSQNPSTNVDSQRGLAPSYPSIGHGGPHRHHI